MLHRMHAPAVAIAAVLAAACGGHASDTSTSSSSSTSSGGTDPCAALSSCSDCAGNPACGYCYETSSCKAGDANGPASGSCASWQPSDEAAVCFGPILCDPRPAAAAGAPCTSGQACYIVSSTEGTRCLPTGSQAPGSSCTLGATADLCQPGYACEFESAAPGACDQVCELGDPAGCPAGVTCQLDLGVLHGPYGVCR
jgi:hypothetical protein